MTEFIGADQPLGRSKKLSYQMTADRYAGRVLYATFETKTDLSQWLPAPLKPVDPHLGFLKLYSLRRWPDGGEPNRPSFSQYYEACVTVEAAPPGEPSRHYNLFMWVTHDWAIYKARAALGWPKKIADISMTETYPMTDGQEIIHVKADVSRYGHNIISLDAELDPSATAQPMPAFNGFYTVRHIPSPAGPEEDIHELLSIHPKDGWVSDNVWGTGSVRFNGAPDEELDLLGDVNIKACVLRNTGWVLPAWPARRLQKLGPLRSDIGDKFSIPDQE